MPKTSHPPPATISGPRRRSSRVQNTNGTTAETESSSNPPGSKKIHSLRPDRNEHPGAADVPRTKRSSAEVAQERKEEEENLKKKEKAQNESIKKAAAIEDKLLQDEAVLRSSHPSTNTPQKKTKRTRETDEVLVDPESDNKNKRKKDMPGIDRHANVPEDVETDESDNSPPNDTTTWHTDSGEDSDEFVLGDDEPDKPESEDEESKGEDEGDGRPVKRQRKGSRKENRGKLREAVSAKRILPTSSIVSAKKNNPPTSKASISKSLKKRPHINGIRNDWQTQTYVKGFSDELMEAERNANEDTGFSGSDPAQVPSSSTGSTISSDAELPRGISDDEGGKIERRGLASKAKVPKHSVASCAAVIPTTSVSSYIPPDTLLKRPKKKQDIRSKVDLPPHLKLNFESYFVPRLRELIGILPGWVRPSEEQVGSLWKEAFPEEPFEGWLKLVVTKLVEDSISNWRAKMAKAAVDYFEKSIIPTLRRKDSSKESIAEWCQWALSNDYKCRPFYYLSYEEGEEQITAKGIFQHPLILATLAYHYSSISQIHPDARVQERPIGALATAIQASHRTISRWLTGEFMEIRRPLQDFSKDNRGDNMTRDPAKYPMFPQGVIQESKSTSSLMRVISKLQDKTWDKIITGAMNASRRQKAVTVKGPADQGNEDIVEEPESDFSIVDNDSD